MNGKFKYLIGCCGLMLAACSSDDVVKDVEPIIDPEPAPQEVVEFNLSAAELSVARQTASFAADFFKAVNDQQKDESGNMVVSPLSAQILLSMLANAGSDAAAREIADVMGCTDMDALNSLCRKYLLGMPSIDEDVAMALANSVWYNKIYNLLPEFSTTLNYNFGTEALQRDFTNSIPVVAEINQWCADHTNNLIDHIVDVIPATTAAFFANAIYFKGGWTIPFEEKSTTQATFYGTERQAEVPMMKMTSDAYYKAGDKYQAVKLSFGNKSFSVWFVLPEQGADINGFIPSFNAAELNSDYRVKMVDLTLPKFKFATDEIELRDALCAVGVKEIFKGDNMKMFTTTFSGDLKVSQKSTIEFNEEGAEASSVTWGQWDNAVNPGDIPTIEPVKVTFDRPFLFFITEQQTGACLMAGKIAQL